MLIWEKLIKSWYVSQNRQGQISNRRWALSNW